MGLLVVVADGTQHEAGAHATIWHPSGAAVRVIRTQDGGWVVSLLAEGEDAQDDTAWMVVSE